MTNQTVVAVDRLRPSVFVVILSEAERPPTGGDRGLTLLFPIHYLRFTIHGFSRFTIHGLSVCR